MLIFMEDFEKMLLTELKRRHFRSDLALEAGIEKGTQGEITREEKGRFRIFRERGDTARATFLFPEDILLSEKEERLLSSLAAEEILCMGREAGAFSDRPKRILAVGLGNGKIAADSLGYHFTEGITATGHLESRPELFPGVSLVKIFPTTEGESGLQPLVQIRAIAEAFLPDLVLVADALCTGSLAFLGKTLQISDGGIVPGSGIRRPKCEISSATVGFYTVAVGLPTVISGATLVLGAIENAGGEDLPEDFEETLVSLSDFYVSPKEVDRISAFGGRILSGIAGKI